MALTVLLILDGKVSVQRLSLRLTGRLGLERQERKLPTFGRPPVIGYSIFEPGELHRLAARCPDEIELLLVAPIRQKRDPFPVRRPSRSDAVAFGGASQLIRLLPFAPEPDLVVEPVVVPLGGAERIGNRLAIG